MQTSPHLRTALAVIVLTIAAAGPVAAGTIGLTWDSVPGASGYRVFYGITSGNYTSTANVVSPTALIQNLDDCRPWYVAVKAFNGVGESAEYSNEISGWPRPEITGASPTSVRQGEQIVLDIYGRNFQTGATVDIGNPPRERIYVSSLKIWEDENADPNKCASHAQLVLTVDPPAPGVAPARAETLSVTIVNPDSVFGERSNTIEILVNPARFDLAQSSEMTRGTIDVEDQARLNKAWRSRAGVDGTYDPDSDFDGDGWVDGTDLAYLASYFGWFWTGTGWSRTQAAGSAAP